MIHKIIPIETRVETVHSEQMDSCSICLETIQDTNRETFRTKCKHTFHKACWDSYLLYKMERGEPITCPICREKMNQENSILYTNDRNRISPLNINNSQNRIFLHVGTPVTVNIIQSGDRSLRERIMCDIKIFLALGACTSGVILTLLKLAGYI